MVLLSAPYGSGKRPGDITTPACTQHHCSGSIEALRVDVASISLLGRLKSAWPYDGTLWILSREDRYAHGKSISLCKGTFPAPSCGGLVQSPSSSPSLPSFFSFCFENVLKIDYLIIQLASMWQQSGLRSAWKIWMTNSLPWLWAYLVSRFIHWLEDGHPCSYQWKGDGVGGVEGGKLQGSWVFQEAWLSSLLPSSPHIGASPIPGTY